MAMASSKPLVAMALLLLVALVVVADAQPAAPKIDCPSACKARCAKNWKNEMCNQECNICCGKCNCVPSGTSQSTRNECPCYANMVNSKTGKLKCP